MSKPVKSDSLLGSFRALDLTDWQGFLCGRILGDFGADVIKIEKPGGEPGRNIGPFFHDIPDPQKSLYWFAFNANKRGITLDIETSDGREIFKMLVKTADFVIESFPPSYLDNLGLGYSVLSENNPSLIMTSISPFGQSGPYRDYKASDLVAMAMSGFMYLTGDPDRSPVGISFPQAYLCAASQAALGTMVAHYHREITGEGQWVDISLQASLLPFTQNAPLSWDIDRINLQRVGPRRALSGMSAHQRLIWPCRGGYVAFGIYGGKLGAPSNRELVKWMDSEGLAPDFLKQIEWDAFDVTKVSQEEFNQLEETIGVFFRKHNRAELYEEALKRDMMLYPVATSQDIYEDPQLGARDFWTAVDHGELGTITYPETFVKLSATPCSIRRRAPLIGEHNQAIYEQELGFAKERLVMLKQAGII